MAAAKRSAKRSQDGPSYLPTCRNGRTGADLSVLRARPAPIAAAALDRRHECALRDGLARPSLQRAADERARRRSEAIRAAKCVGVLTEVLCVLATAYCEYSPVVYSSVLVSSTASSVGGGGAGAPAEGYF